MVYFWISEDVLYIVCCMHIPHRVIVCNVYIDIVKKCRVDIIMVELDVHSILKKTGLTKRSLHLLKNEENI